MLVHRPIPRYQCLPPLYLAGFMLLVAASMLVASIPGALATDSDDRGPTSSVGIHTFTSSDGTKITYTMIMAFNASRDIFGPQVYMDADNKAAMCAISSSDTQTISAFRHSLADAFVKEAAYPGRGLPRVAVERSFADDWAAKATNGIMSRCLLAKNGGGAPIMIAAHDQGLNFY